MTFAPQQATPASRQPITYTIDPSHAWMLGLLVADGGSYVPPPAAGSHTGIVSHRPANEAPACNCPDFCDLDHEFD